MKTTIVYLVTEDGQFTTAGIFQNAGVTDHEISWSMCNQL